MRLEPSADAREERPLRVLISAYACEPDRGSEPEVGWQWAWQMARFHDVTVVTRANNRAAIEGAAAPGPSRPHFIYYDPPPWLITLKQFGLPVAVFYTVWQIGVRRAVAHRLSTFDLIHHVTFNSFRQPGFWWGCRRPVILGPLGGGQLCPWRFLPSLGARAISEISRSASVVASGFLPHLHLSLAASTTVLVANRDTARRIPRRFRSKVHLHLETGILREHVRRDSRSTGTGKRCIWVSRFDRTKGAWLALQAFSRAVRAEPELTLSMVGYGSDEQRLKRLAARLGIAHAVTWHGKVPKADVPRLLDRHDIFLFTSIRDTSGNVLLEAMAAALPVVTLRHQGAAEIATDETALRIVPTRVDTTVARLSEAMVTLARSRELRERLGHAGRDRVLLSYTWEAKGRHMNRVYRDTVARFEVPGGSLSPAPL